MFGRKFPEFSENRYLLNLTAGKALLAAFTLSDISGGCSDVM